MRMHFEFEDTKPLISNDQLLEDIRRVAASVGAFSVAQNTYRSAGQFSTTAIKKRFGSWNAAVEAAGLAAPYRRDVSEEDLFDNLREVWIKLGRQPRKREMSSPVSRYTHHPYIRRFGGWLDAMRTFVDSVESSTGTMLAPSQAASNKSRGSRDPSVGLRFVVMRRDNFKCTICGRSPAMDPSIELQCDHVTPWSKGGATTFENLRTLCSKCNLGKGNLFDKHGG